MPAVIAEEPIANLAMIAAVPIAFTVTSIWSLRDGVAHEKPVEHPYLKDYDALPNNAPSSWPSQFDTGRWGLLTARVDGDMVGDAVVAAGILDLIPDGRPDIAVLWDLRVAPAFRGHGIGTSLLEAAERWACARGYVELRIETQDTNARACRFYQRLGYELLSILPNAYADLPKETQLVWRKAPLT